MKAESFLTAGLSGGAAPMMVRLAILLLAVIVLLSLFAAYPILLLILVLIAGGLGVVAFAGSSRRGPAASFASAVLALANWLWFQRREKSGVGRIDPPRMGFGGP